MLKEVTPAMAKKVCLNPKGSWSLEEYGGSQVVKVEKTVFLAGHVSVDEKGNLVGGNSMEAQLRQIFRNIEHDLAAIGGSLDDIVTLTMYYTRLTEKDATGIKKVRKEVIKKGYPASTGVRVAGLALPGALIEVNAIAALD